MRTVDLFAGCGGMSLGFHRAGFKIVGAFENWPIAADCYKNNLKHPVYIMDLSDTTSAVKTIKSLKPDVIIGGPPCQDFSHAGKRVEASRASLTCSYAEIVETVKPKYFVMENVDRILKSHAYAQARKIFKAAGYGLIENVVDASLCGVPQKRRRFFCIGAYNQPDNFISTPLSALMSKHATTLRDYFGNTLDFEYYYRHPRNYSRRAIFSIDEPAPTIRGVNRPVPKGYAGHPNDACPLNDSIRALTTLERALIQTFPPDYKWSGSKTEMEQMIGNAVPVKLAEFIANYLGTYALKNRSRNFEREQFIRWLINEKLYASRSASDIASRVKRANSYQLISVTPAASYRAILDSDPNFSKLSSSVKSQVKRAVVLYCEYKRGVGNERCV